MNKLAEFRQLQATVMIKKELQELSANYVYNWILSHGKSQQDKQLVRDMIEREPIRKTDTIKEWVNRMPMMAPLKQPDQQENVSYLVSKYEKDLLFHIPNIKSATSKLAEFRQLASSKPFPKWFPNEYWAQTEEILVMVSRLFGYGWTNSFKQPSDVIYNFSQEEFSFIVRFKNQDMYWKAFMSDENHSTDTGDFKKVKSVGVLGKELEDASSDMMAELYRKNNRTGAKLASSITQPQIGDTHENEKIRFSLYELSVRVTDLTNAGRRGKTVDRFSVGSWPHLTSEVRMWARELHKLDYDTALRKAKENGFEIHESKDRGVDVTPAGFEPIIMRTDNFFLRSDYKDFVVKDLKDHYNEPTCIPAISGGKKDIKVFYRWVKDNEAKIKKMTFEELTLAMSNANIRSHSYCAMD